MALTPAQENAIAAGGNDLLISAAAGSGKTFTLTKRIIKAIIDDGRDIDRMLIVTFTRAAAGELKEKISAAIAAAAAEHPENEHLQNQMIKLGSATISTIDSFFAEPVRTNFDKLGLPAAPRLCDENELDDMRRDILEEVIGELLESDGFSTGSMRAVGARSDLSDLIGIISAARDSSNLCPTLIGIYKKLITSREGIGLLKHHAERMERCAKLDFFDCAEGQHFRERLADRFNYFASFFAQCVKEIEQHEELSETYRPFFSKNQSSCLSMRGRIMSEGYSEVAGAIESFSLGSIPRLKKEDESPFSLEIKDKRAKMLKQINDFKKASVYPLDEISRSFSTNAALLKILYEILYAFDRRYSEEKLSAGICEFSDMPKFMLELLVDGNGNPTEYAQTLSDRYDEIYVDEYQDVNEIQDGIFAAIGKGHRFMVGDIKQSIYCFRDAEPTIFAKYRREFPNYDARGTCDPGNTIFMSNNFRCDRSVIDFTNIVCTSLLGAFAKSIGYSPEDDNLVFTKETAEGYVPQKVQINIVERPKELLADADSEGDSEGDGDGAESGRADEKLADEAAITANEIARLIKVGKKSDGKPITASDIAILSRGHASVLPLLADLDALNIKYSVSSGSSVFEDRQMRLLVDLLHVIDNPHEDMHLCSLLESECAGHSALFSFGEIVEIKTASEGSIPLFEAMCSFSEGGTPLAERCKSFIETVRKFRRLASRLSADKLLREIRAFDEFSAVTDGAPYTYLYDCACKYVKRAWNGLGAFLVYLTRLTEGGSSSAEGDSSDDAVSVMTIHQSKGLERNTCFLFGCGKEFNKSDTSSPLIFNKEFGVSFKLPPKKQEGALTPEDAIESIKVRFVQSPIWAEAGKLLYEKQLEEEARILYVAMTRAKERLYVSATLRKGTDFDTLYSALADCVDLKTEILRSNTFISWILLALSHNATGDEPYCINVRKFGECVLDDPVTAEYRASDAPESENLDDKEKERLKKQNEAEAALTDLYASLSSGKSEGDDRLSTVPSKIAASKASSRMLDKSVFTPLPVGTVFSALENGGEEDTGGSVERDDRETVRNRIELMKSAPPSFESLLDVNKKPTAAERGTATHLFLQFCNYRNVEKFGIANELDRLVEEGFISRRNADMVNTRKLLGFFESELYTFIEGSKVRREFKFGIYRPLEDFAENAEIKKAVSGKRIFVQGSIDLIIERPNGDIYVCDYKTDRITGEERADPSVLAEKMAEKHAEQLQQYAYAVTEIFGKPPTKTFIFSVDAGVALEIAIAPQAK